MPDNRQRKEASMLRRFQAAWSARRSRSVRPRTVVGFLIVVTVGSMWIASSQAASANPKRIAANGDVVTFHVVFTGSGNATSAYPPAPSNTTIFTTSIQWSLAYDVSLTLGEMQEASVYPVSGSTLTGVSNGVAAPGGVQIEPGCEQIGLSLDATQPGATLPAGAGPTYELDLAVPGFDDGALLAYRPMQCGNPFPTDAGGPGCPDHVDYVSPVLRLDPNKATETWPLKGTCNIPNESQAASWTGTVTATRTSPPPGIQYAGHTKQRCSRWDGNCHPGHLPIVFETRGGLLENFAAQDEGRCNHKLHSQDSIGGAYVPTPRPVKIGSDGVFTIKYRLNKGAFVATVKGTITSAGSQGVLSATGRYNLRTHRPDRHGRVICRARKIHWTAAPSPS